jgi:hypothetical protein
MVQVEMVTSISYLGKNTHENKLLLHKNSV